MSSLPRVGYPGRQAWIGLLISGVLFTLHAALLWMVFLAVSLGLSLLWYSRHTPLPRLFAIGPDGIASALWFAGGVGGVTFLAALLAARSRWSHRPGLSAFLVSLLTLVFCLGRASWPTSNGSGPAIFSSREIIDLITLALPLVTAPLGGWLGMRWFGSE